jgi:hypothetical protein
MFLKKSKTVIACAVALVISCAVFVTPVVQTTIEAENNLNAMTVDVGGVSTSVNGIDLEGVAIGDVFYTSIPYGTVSSEKVTNRSGDVTVDIGTAVVLTRVLNQTVSIAFTNISPMVTTITPATLNTVIFDETTAGVIFSAFAKKKI